MNNEFLETRQMFADCINYTDPLSYIEWINIHDEYKAAGLYLTFYKQIELAWRKAKSPYADEAEGVECVLQYLIKNVPIIIKDEKRYSPQYIYTVAYRCLYNMANLRICDKRRYNLEVSNYINIEGNELDLFDCVTSKTSNSYKGDLEKEIDNIIDSRDFWKELENLGEDVQIVIANLVEKIALPDGFGYNKKAEIVTKLQDILKDSVWAKLYY